MRSAFLSIRDRFDRAGILLSGLCALHCVLGIVLVSMLGLGGELLLDPSIHEIGLAFAIIIGVLSLGFGVLRHGRFGPLAIGAVGLVLMALALGARAVFSGHLPGNRRVSEKTANRLENFTCSDTHPDLHFPIGGKPQRQP